MKKINKNVEQWTYSKAIIFSVITTNIIVWLSVPGLLDGLKEYPWMAICLVIFTFLVIINCLDFIGYISMGEEWRNIEKQKRIWVKL